ncbi:MAG TPA: hypothetical protein PLW44_18110, partial [Chitinophagales bacterium]|nr:hypothetical protein [Chitinophagales bacterium]
NSKKVTETIKSVQVKREPGGTDTAAQSGCALWLWLLGALLLLLGLFTFPAIFKFLLLVLLLMFIFSLIGGALEGKGLGCGGLLLLLILLYLLSNLWKGRSEGGGGGRRTDDGDRSSEIVLDTSSVKRMEGDTLSMKSCLNWLDFTPQSYEACFSVSQKQYFAAKYTRENYHNSIRNVDDWRRLYTLLTKTDINNLPGIYEKYDSIRRTNQLSEYKFAEMVVTSVQEIPYSYVMPEECTGGEGKPCIGNIKFGVQSPSEFFYTLQGDCDTRAVFLFTVLTHYGYDVAVIISPAYEHAMLAVNLPYTGSYLRYGGKKYFVWETTAKYQHLGEINPQWGNMDNWEICLVSKQ